ncbi:MAG TPA: STAS domain-containing protein [Candidatus Rubrimentiphilum sp.]|nr:STAS domain-containing protein [Candidatus Rubrimentiphilum sp.]
MEKPRVVRLEGDWDIARRDELERLLGPVSDAPSEVILDLASVNYADSTILAELVVLRNRRRTKNLPLPRLVIGSPQVRRLFSISGLDQAFPTYDSVPDAQAAASAE